ncbi:hypothetical protein GCM10027063_31210 [Promicromonospora xylanilytica]
MPALSNEPLPEDQLDRLRRIQADAVARLTLSKDLDERKRGASQPAMARRERSHSDRRQQVPRAQPATLPRSCW